MGLTLAATQVSEQKKPLVNVDANGVGLHGYHPVAYFTDGREIRSTNSKYDEATSTSSRATTRRRSTRNLKGLPPNTAAIVRWRWRWARSRTAIPTTFSSTTGGYSFSVMKKPT